MNLHKITNRRLLFGTEHNNPLKQKLKRGGESYITNRIGHYFLEGKVAVLWSSMNLHKILSEEIKIDFSQNLSLKLQY